MLSVEPSDVCAPFGLSHVGLTLTVWDVDALVAEEESKRCYIWFSGKDKAHLSPLESSAGPWELLVSRLSVS